MDWQGCECACGLYKCWLLSFCLVIRCLEREYLSGVWTLAISISSKLNRLVRAIRPVSALLQQFSSGDSVCRHSARGPRLIPHSGTHLAGSDSACAWLSPQPRYWTDWTLGGNIARLLESKPEGWAFLPPAFHLRGSNLAQPSSNHTEFAGA